MSRVLCFPEAGSFPWTMRHPKSSFVVSKGYGLKTWSQMQRALWLCLLFCVTQERPGVLDAIENQRWRKPLPHLEGEQTKQRKKIGSSLGSPDQFCCLGSLISFLAVLPLAFTLELLACPPEMGMQTLWPNRLSLEKARLRNQEGEAQRMGEAVGWLSVKYSFDPILLFPEIVRCGWWKSKSLARLGSFHTGTCTSRRPCFPSNGYVCGAEPGDKVQEAILGFAEAVLFPFW